MAAIGKVTEYRIKSTDSFDNEYDNKIWGSLNPSTTYEQIDAASRALIGLSKNTYGDSILITEISVNEVLAG
mgnify:CR=1 FL=1